MSFIPVTLKQILSELRDPVIFELGVYDGINTQHLVMSCEVGSPRYYAFEPDPRNIEKCLLHIPETVNFYQAAIGNVTGKVPFHVSSPNPNGETASSSISPFRDHVKVFDWCKEEAVIDVSSWRLDDFCEAYEVGHIDLIYMDIQGAERLMIEGAQKILQRTKYIFTEFEGLTRETQGSLYEHSSSLEHILSMLPGWTAIEVLPGDALLKNNQLQS
jgi:FkbM family methyltransferase